MGSAGLQRPQSWAWDADQEWPGVPDAQRCLGISQWPWEGVAQAVPIHPGPDLAGSRALMPAPWTSEDSGGPLGVELRA